MNLCRGPARLGGPGVEEQSRPLLRLRYRTQFVGTGHRPPRRPARPALGFLATTHPGGRGGVWGRRRAEQSEWPAVAQAVTRSWNRADRVSDVSRGTRGRRSPNSWGGRKQRPKFAIPSARGRGPLTERESDGKQRNDQRHVDALLLQLYALKRSRAGRPRRGMRRRGQPRWSASLPRQRLETSPRVACADCRREFVCCVPSRGWR